MNIYTQAIPRAVREANRRATVRSSALAAPRAVAFLRVYLARKGGGSGRLCVEPLSDVGSGPDVWLLALFVRDCWSAMK